MATMTTKRAKREPRKPCVRTTWAVWTYDVWGNARDGYEVNDRRCLDRACELVLPLTMHNVGQPSEFGSAAPTNRQLREAFGLDPRVKIDVDGDDLAIYVSRARDGYPIGEMFCTSHESLSPVEAILESESRS